MLIRAKEIVGRITAWRSCRRRRDPAPFDRGARLERTPEAKPQRKDESRNLDTLRGPRWPTNSTTDPSSPS